MTCPHGPDQGPREGSLVKSRSGRSAPGTDVTGANVVTALEERGPGNPLKRKLPGVAPLDTKNKEESLCTLVRFFGMGRLVAPNSLYAC